MADLRDEIESAEEAILRMHDSLACVEEMDDYARGMRVAYADALARIGMAVAVSERGGPAHDPTPTPGRRAV